VAGHEPPKAHPHPQVNRQLTPGILKGEGPALSIHLIDIGVNLTHRSFQSNREAVIARAHRCSRRCVGPKQVAHSRFVTSVDPTEARNAGQEKSGESICEFLAHWYDEP
jgi:hypothetical protein